MPLPFLLGLTGSIAMGKSTVAGQFAYLGVPTVNADNIVHRLYAPGGKAVPLITGLYPDAVRGGAVDRSRLSAEVLDRPDRLAELESLIHPLVRAEEEAFVRRMARLGHSIVLLDIPLLYETGAERRLDAVAVVTAPAFIQRQRALRRPGMTEERLASILARQMPDREKRLRADFIIPTSLGKRYSLGKVREILDIVAHDPSYRAGYRNHRF